MSVPCILIYDLRDQPYNVWLALAGAGLILVGAVWARVMRSRKGFGRWAILAIAVVWAVSSAYGVLWRTHVLRAAMAAGHYDVVSGVISSYSAAQEDEKRGDEFVVNGILVSVPGESHLEPGFHKMRREGSPLDTGTPVRLAMIGDTVVRVEICAAAPEGR